MSRPGRYRNYLSLSTAGLFPRRALFYKNAADGSIRPDASDGWLLVKESDLPCLVQSQLSYR